MRGQERLEKLQGEIYTLGMPIEKLLEEIGKRSRQASAVVTSRSVPAQAFDNLMCKNAYACFQIMRGIVVDIFGFVALPFSSM